MFFLHVKRKDFRKMDYTVNKIVSREAKRAEKYLASFLAEKWRQEFLEMVLYVRVQMAFAVVIDKSFPTQGSCNRQRSCRPIISDRVTMYD